MSKFTDSLLVGFLNGTAENIDRRTKEADDYFARNMELAQKYAMSSREQHMQNMQASKQVVGQLAGAGVPEDVIRNIASQNPQDLQQFYAEITEMQAKGVKLSEMGPDIYRKLITVAKEQGTTPANVLAENGEPLANNMKADPDAFRADPEGSIWSTLLGHNAMQQAQRRLEKTMIGGQSASDIIASGGISDDFDTGGGFNYELAGELTREATEERKPPKEKNPKYFADIAKSFIDFSSEEIETRRAEIIRSGADPASSESQIKAEAQAIAVQRLLDFGYPMEDIQTSVGTLTSPNVSPAPTAPASSSVLPPLEQRVEGVTTFKGAVWARNSSGQLGWIRQ